jgi:hypothetical protein
MTLNQRRERGLVARPHSRHDRIVATSARQPPSPDTSTAGWTRQERYKRHTKS